MKTVTILTTIPDNSIIASGFDKIDYCDACRITKATNDTAEELAAKIFTLSNRVKGLLGIRDAVAGLFGLKTGKEIQQGQKTFFPVIEQHENEIVMGENDRHLDFRVSVLIDRENAFVYLTTIVRFNNFFGRLYFLPVKPFHKIIVKASLKRLTDEI